MIAALTAWLSSFFVTVMEWLYNIVIDVLQVLLDGVCTVALHVVTLFPAGPSVPSIGGPSGSAASAVVGAIGWLLPVSYLLSVVTFVAGSIAAYFIIAPVARWFKLIT